MDDPFTAKTKYNDFKGTAAADGSDTHSIDGYLRERGLISDTEMVVAVRFWSGENFEGKSGSPGVSAYVTQKDKVNKRQVQLGRENDVRLVDVEVSQGKFFGFFKRFEVLIERDGVTIV